MARPTNTHQRRAEIVEGLSQAMASRGYRAATVQHIAKAAGLSPGLVHYHFKTKGAVLLALIATLEDRIAARVDAAVTPEDKLDALIEALVGRGPGADDAAVRSWTLVAAEATVDDEVRDAFERAVLRLAETLDGLVASALGCAPDDEAAREVSAQVLALVHGAFLLSAAAPKSIVPGFAAQGVRRLLAAAMAERP